MKKFALVLLLTALCLSLAACDLPFDLPFGSQASEGDGFSGLYAMMEQGDYVAAMNTVNEIREGRLPGEQEGFDQNLIAGKYAQLSQALKKKDYSQAAQLVVTAASDYFRNSVQTEKNLMTQMLIGNWYESLDNPDYVEMPMVLEYNGKLVSSRLDDKLYWIVETCTAEMITVQIYSQGSLQSAGTLEVKLYGEVVGMKYASAQKGGGSLYYWSDRLLTGAYSEWLSPEQDSQFPNRFSVEGNQMMIDGNFYSLRQQPGELMALAEDGSVLYTISGCDSENGEFYVELRNDYGKRTYYQPGSDYELAEKRYHYQRALDVLYCLKGCDSSLDFNGDERTVQEWYDYVYKAMQDVSGYGDSVKILGNFTILEDLLVGRGEQRTLLQKEYKYDSLGRVIYARDADLTLQYYGLQGLLYPAGTECDDQYHFEYDASGRISKITHMNFQTLVSTITPVYDAQGKIDSLEIRMADGTTRSADYVYDSDIMMPFATVPTATESDVLREINYGEYFLNFSWTPDFENYWFSGVSGWIDWKGEDVSYSSSWETDANHVLTKKTIWISSETWELTAVHTYTYDGNGRLLSEKVVTTQGDNSWEATYHYFYETQYFYNFDAE